MKNFFLIFIFILASCSPNTTRNNFTFSDKMSFEEFKIKLDEYAKNNPYPKIDD